MPQAREASRMMTAADLLLGWDEAMIEAAHALRADALCAAQHTLKGAQHTRREVRPLARSLLASAG